LNNGYYVDAWILDYNACVQTDPNGKVDPNGFKNFYDVLYVKWKNIEVNASPQIISATWHWSLLKGETDAITVGPFALNMPAPAFSSGTSLNIPCYITTAVTISLSSYINTEANGIDQGETITSKFEWTLPSGWQTTSGQTGIFVSSSSISVIPPASSSSTSISVRAKANLQYSQPTTLQITRNLNDFSISGEPNVVYNTTYRYEVPSIPNATYTWQLPTGWGGSSTTNYIDATVGCSSGNIIATINGCNGSKTSTKSVSHSIIPQGSTISGPNFACSSGTQFTVPGLVSGTNITWNASPNLTLIEASSNYCKYAANSNGEGWIDATINAPACGTSFTLPRKTIWVGVPVINNLTGPIHVDAYGMGFYEINTLLNPSTTYVWSVSPAASVSSSGKSANVYFQGDNDYYVSVYGTNYCGTSATTVGWVTVGSYQPYIIYPNPGDDNITLQANETSATFATSATVAKSSNSDSFDIKVFNEKGNLVKIDKAKSLPYTMHSRNIPEGKYIIQVTNNGKSWSKQLIIKHQ